MQTATNNRILYLAGACWLFLISLGSAALWRYKQTASDDPLAPATWPAASTLARSTQLPTLLLFVHPRCACSHASIGELARLMAHAQGLVSAQVLFFRPDDAAAGWAHGALWTAAAAIPGVAVRQDVGGVEARRFQGHTSGHVVLYDVQGHRLFDGGITASRGHAGDSPGLGALLALLHKQTSRQWHTAIFGCRIRDGSYSKREGKP